MDRSIPRIRFLLFTQSYVGYRLVNWLNQHKDDRHYIERLGEILRFEKKDLSCFILHTSCCRKFKAEIQKRVKNDKEVIIYLQIENELITLTKEKEEIEDPETEDYNERALLSTAVERVVGNSLSYIKTDSWFDKRLLMASQKYNHWYYKIVDKYKLPTMRIIPFLLRILSINN